MGADMGAIPASLMTKYDLVPQGLAAEMVAEKWKYTRQQLDEFALESQRRAWAAIQDGRFKKSIVPMTVTTADGSTKTFDTDEHPAPAVDARRPDVAAGVVQARRRDPRRATRAASSTAPPVCCSANKRGLERLGLKPRARIVDTVVVGSSPSSCSRARSRPARRSSSGTR
jgi:acetyl-CoA acetyltransferase